MELFGIILSIPFCFIATVLGTHLLRFVIKRLSVPPRYILICRQIAVFFVISAILNILVSLLFGACEAWKLVGSAYITISGLVFFLSSPSLVFLLATNRDGKVRLDSPFVYTLRVVPFCLLIIIEQYDKSEKLFGVDNLESPDISCSRE